MPTTAATAETAWETTWKTKPEQLMARLSSSSSSGDISSVYTVLRDIKNQVIGNPRKKLAYIKSQLVPKLVSLLNSPDVSPEVIVQAAVTIGSLAYGTEEGIHAVVDAGALSTLTTLLSHSDAKVDEVVVRSLRIMYQTKKAMKFDFFAEKNMAFFLSLLHSPHENRTELAACMIANSCTTAAEQILLCDNGVFEKLISLLRESANQRDASLDAISAIVRNNSQVISIFVSMGNGKGFNCLNNLITHKNPRTRLLASTCLILIQRSKNPNRDIFMGIRMKPKLISILLDLIQEKGQIGDEAPFVLRDLVGESEEVQRYAIDLNAIERLYEFFIDAKKKIVMDPKRLEGILLVLGELGSQLEQGRSQLIQLQVPNLLIEMLKHDCLQVRIAACFCIKNISRSLENLSAGRFSTDSIVIPLIQLLCDDSPISVQVAALGALCNVAVNLTSRKSVLLKHGAVPMLTQLTKSNNSEVRLNSVCALRNLMFLLDRGDKDLVVLSQLGLSNLTALICDSDELVQEQALALASNFINGHGDSTNLIFSFDLLHTVSRQLRATNSPKVCIQGMLFLTNLGAIDDAHKDAVLNCILDWNKEKTSTLIIGFLQSKERLVRLATLWCLVNLSLANRHNKNIRVQALQTSGVFTHLKFMKDRDPCLDCKLRIAMVLEQCHDRD